MPVLDPSRTTRRGDEAFFRTKRGDRHQPNLFSNRNGGARRDRTDDLMLAKHALSQLSYGPNRVSQEKAVARLKPGSESLVGLGRLELPTSRLSSARSNQLSYKPEPQSQKPEPTSRSIQNFRRQKGPRRLVREEKETKAAASRIVGPTKDPCSKEAR